ncbi:MAG TPA: CHAT domain-containing protein [Thermomicrobiales bacterium]|nr:CHAT domain-containing protein [Thermomicrobiales bacterium]
MASFDERAFITRVESADVGDFIQVLLSPSAPEEQALRAHLGDERFQRLHGLALKHDARRELAPPRGNVVVIPGLLGSALTAFDRAGAGAPLWLNVPAIAAGALARLRLADDGLAEADPAQEVRVTGILKRQYGELLLALAVEWTVRAFWFDWRKDLRLAAAELEARLNAWFLDDAPIHLVAHGAGGLVARAFIKNAPERWAAMWDRQSATPGARGGRLILLGTPQHGSLTIPQTLLGGGGLVGKLALLDGGRACPPKTPKTPKQGLGGLGDPAELLAVLRSFAGLYQLLPSPLAMPPMHRLYEAATYGRPEVPQRHLDNAWRFHQWLSGVCDPARMLAVLGTDQPTFGDILAWTKLAGDAAYEVTDLGDGVVPHRLGLLARPDGTPVPTYYAAADHGALPTHGAILAALDELLRDGATADLDRQARPRRGGRDARPGAASREEAHRRYVAAQADDERAFGAAVHRFRVRGGASKTRLGAGTPDAGRVTPEEQQLAEGLTRGLLGGAVAPATRPRGVPFAPARVEIGLLHGEIDRLGPLDGGDRPVDAVAVGHYVGVTPQTAELALDRAISRARRGKAARRRPADDLLLTHYTERGVIRGELGQLFFLPDPRPAPEGAGDGPARVIAIAGMGLPGRCGEPELTVLARELCWALGRMGKRHLATVLIGSGKGNLPVREAVSAWIRGVKHAVTGATADAPRHLQRITFVERDPTRVEALDEAIRYEAQALNAENRLQLVYQPLDAEEKQRLRDAARHWLRRAWAREWALRQERRAEPDTREPTRVTVGLGPRTYRFGAITEGASIPEREIPLDPALVMRANDELAAEWNPALQLERGQFLARLLVPDDLRAQFHTDAPLVLVLDAASARIHWELLAQTDLAGAAGHAGDGRGAGDFGDFGEFKDAFLGTSRGFTRQLRTTFAPPPEPPPPPQRLLRVLVVADPAEDAPLPGAEAEGVEVADLFEGFNAVYEGWSVNRVEVVRLFGPREATRTNVLRHLMLRSYDVLHFAGHCVYDPRDPAASGWIFTGGERLSANELRRVDRIPKFVFSNACESGVTPDRAGARSVDLAPSFAESFFARGVANFVCTAWPVDDVAAREFALRLYAGLLGLAPTGDRGDHRERAEAEPMHVAMRRARLAVAGTPGGARTWGAYQHYGNPYLRFFDPATMRRSRASAAGASRGDEADDNASTE